MGTGSLEEVIFTINFGNTTCHTSVCEIISSALPAVYKRVTFGREIEPSDKFTIDSDFLDSLLFLNTPCYFSEIIIAVSCSGKFHPTFFPGCATSVAGEIVSVFAVFDQFVSVCNTITVSHIIISVSTLDWFSVSDQITICIQQIKIVAVTQKLICSDSFFLIISVCIKITPLCTLIGTLSKPSVDCHLTRNISCRCCGLEIADASADLLISYVWLTTIQKIVRSSIDTVNLVCFKIYLFTIIMTIIVKCSLTCIPDPCIGNCLTELRIIRCLLICRKCIHDLNIAFCTEIIEIISNSISSCQKISIFIKCIIS